MATLQRTKVGFGLASALIVAIGVTSYITTRNLISDFEWVSHTLEVRAALEQLASLEALAQTSIRGYYLTDQDYYLQHFEASKNDFLSLLLKIRELTNDNPLQHSRLDRLEPLFKERIERWENFIALYRSKGLPAVQAGIRGDKGKNLDAKIMASISDMGHEEERLLQSRSKEATQTAERAFFIIALGALAALGVINLASYLLSRDSQKRMAAEAERDLFFTTSLDLLCVAGADGYFKRLNPAFQKILGYTPEELMAQPILEFVHPDDRVRTIQELSTSTRDSVISFENRYVCKDGTSKWLSWKSVPVKNLIYATARDVTEARQYRERITQSQMFLDSIIENIPSMIVIKDATTLQGLRINRAGTELLGISSESWIGKTDAEIFSDDIARSSMQRDREIIESRSIVDIPEVSITTSDKGERFLHTKKLAISGPNNSRYLLAISEDITDRKWAEKNLIRARQEAEAANRTKSEFLANMSHEIRTPLNGVVGMTDLLMTTNLDPQQKKFMQVVQDSGSNLLSIINDILDFSKIEAGKMDLEVLPFDPVSVIENPADLLSGRAAQKICH